MSTHGRVKSNWELDSRGRDYGPRILKPGGGDYQNVTLTTESGLEESNLVSRLVAETFLVSPSYLFTVVNHLDGNKHNNHLDNLEWCSPLNNRLHATMSGLTPKTTSKYMGVQRHPESDLWRFRTPMPFGGKYWGSYPSEYRAAREYERWIKHFNYHLKPYWVPLNFEIIIPPRIYRDGPIQTTTTT